LPFSATSKIEALARIFPRAQELKSFASFLQKRRLFFNFNVMTLIRRNSPERESGLRGVCGWFAADEAQFGAGRAVIQGGGAADATRAAPKLADAAWGKNEARPV
jgi:hypothetical protein